MMMMMMMIWLIDGILTGTNTLGYSPSDGLVSYPGHPSAKKPSAYSKENEEVAQLSEWFYSILIICLCTIK